MDYQKTASEILKNIGGKENIAHLEHCSTRLRFTLKDDDLVDIPALEKIDGVMGVRQNVQCQVIIGNDVVEVYNEVLKQTGTIDASTDEVTSGRPKKKRKF